LLCNFLSALCLALIFAFGHWSFKIRTLPREE
jgi:hypothetical protein